jgi:hypothetical protein
VKRLQPITFPNRSTVDFDYGYKQGVLKLLKRPNRFICGYCLEQAPTPEQITHIDGCPEGKRA